MTPLQLALRLPAFAELTRLLSGGEGEPRLSGDMPMVALFRVSNPAVWRILLALLPDEDHARATWILYGHAATVGWLSVHGVPPTHGGVVGSAWTERHQRDHGILPPILPEAPGTTQEVQDLLDATGTGPWTVTLTQAPWSQNEWVVNARSPRGVHLQAGGRTRPGALRDLPGPHLDREVWRARLEPYLGADLSLLRRAVRGE